MRRLKIDTNIGQIMFQPTIVQFGVHLVEEDIFQ